MSNRLFKILAVLVVAVFPVITMASSVSDRITGIINRALSNVVWPIFIGLVVIMSIWAGILFLIAQGDATKVAQARKAFLWVVIGILVAVFGYSAYATINSILSPLPLP